MTPAELRERLSTFPSLPFIAGPTPVESMTSLPLMLGGGPKLFIKRDDAITFGFGGNGIEMPRDNVLNREGLSVDSESRQ